MKNNNCASITNTTKPRKSTKHILITGSSGYVGQHLIASLLLGEDEQVNNEECDEEIQYVLYCAYHSLATFEKDVDAFVQKQLHLSHQTLRARIHLIPNVDFSQSNYIQVIRDAITNGQRHAKDESSIMIPPPPIALDAIVHLAALSSPAYCEQNPSLAYPVNCPLGLLQFNAPIIYMSTDQVYEGTKSYYKEDVDETVPVNVYGRSKLAFERVLLRTGCKPDDQDTKPLLTKREMGKDDVGSQYLQDITTTYSSCFEQTTSPSPYSNSAILRSSLILGPPPPSENGCKRGPCPSFLQFIEERLKSSTPTEYYANEYRSVVYIHDVIKAIRHFLDKACTTASTDPSSSNLQVYNLGGSARVSRTEVAMEVARHLNLDSSSIMAINRPIDNDHSRGHVPSPSDISMNVDKITREMNVLRMKGLQEIVHSSFA